MLDLRDLKFPVVGAPMAGGPSRPALASAISGAGGLGFLAGGYKTAHQVEAEVEELRTTSTAPFGLNLFMVEPYAADPGLLKAYRSSLRRDAARLGVDPGIPKWDNDCWQAKIDLVLAVRPDVVSFTFGCPSPKLLGELKKHGVLTMVIVTTQEEARQAVTRGAASVALLGRNAGGHRGSWDQEASHDDRTPLPDLVSAVVSAVDVPVVAGGGVADGQAVASLLERGAVAALVGTAYLLAQEAGTNWVHRAALGNPAFDSTTMTRAFSGRWARGLTNRFMLDHADAPAGYPQIHYITAPLRAAAIAAGDPHTAHLWAGVEHRQARTASASDITCSLAP